MKEALAALFELQQVDTRIALLEKRFRALDTGGGPKAAAAAASGAHAAAVSSLETARRDMLDAELEQKTVENKKAAHEKKLYGGKVTAFKELETLQQEIESLGRQRGRLDEKILELMDAIDERAAREDQTRRVSEEAAAAAAAAVGAYEAEARKIARAVRDLRKLREERLAPVPADLARRYESMRAHKDGVAIARLVEPPTEDPELGGPIEARPAGITAGRRPTCGACGTNVSADVVTHVRSGKQMEYCENCGRILCEIITAREESS